MLVREKVGLGNLLAPAELQHELCEEAVDAIILLLDHVHDGHLSLHAILLVFRCVADPIAVLDHPLEEHLFNLLTDSLLLACKFEQVDIVIKKLVLNQHVLAVFLN